MNQLLDDIIPQNHTYSQHPCKKGLCPPFVRNYSLKMIFFFHKSCNPVIRRLFNSSSIKGAHENDCLFGRHCILYHYSSTGTNENMHLWFNRKGHALLICAVHYNNFVMLKCFLRSAVGNLCLVGSNWRRALRLPPVTSLPQLNLQPSLKTVHLTK